MELIQRMSERLALWVGPPPTDMQEPSASIQHPEDFPKAPVSRTIRETEGRQDEVEAPGREPQAPGVHSLEFEIAPSFRFETSPREVDHPGSRVDTDYASRRTDGARETESVGTRTTAQIQYTDSAKTRHQPAHLLPDRHRRSDTEPAMQGGHPAELSDEQSFGLVHPHLRVLAGKVDPKVYRILLERPARPTDHDYQLRGYR